MPVSDSATIAFMMGEKSTTPDSFRAFRALALFSCRADLLTRLLVVQDIICRSALADNHVSATELLIHIKYPFKTKVFHAARKPK